MSHPFREHARRMAEDFLTHEASTPQELRRAVEGRCARHAGARRGDVGDVPPELAAYVDTVARNAYKVTDADVAALQAAGWSEDEIFEITLAAALGAGLGRLERGIEVLEGERDAP